MSKNLSHHKHLTIRNRKQMYTSGGVQVQKVGMVGQTRGRWQAWSSSGDVAWAIGQSKIIYLKKILPNFLKRLHRDKVASHGGLWAYMNMAYMHEHEDMCLFGTTGLASHGC